MPSTQVSSDNKRKRSPSPAPFATTEQKSLGRGCRKRCKTQKAKGSDLLSAGLPDSANAANVDKTKGHTSLHNLPKNQDQHVTPTAPQTVAPHQKIRLISRDIDPNGEVIHLNESAIHAILKPTELQEPAPVKLKLKLNYTPPTPASTANNDAATQDALRILARRGMLEPKKIKIILNNPPKRAETGQTGNAEPAKTARRTSAPQVAAKTALAAKTKPKPAAKPRRTAAPTQKVQQAPHTDNDLDRANKVTGSGPYEIRTAGDRAPRKINAAEHPVQHLIQYLENMEVPPRDDVSFRRRFLKAHINNDLKWLNGSLDKAAKNMFVKQWWSRHWKNPWEEEWKEFKVKVCMKKNNFTREAAINHLAWEAREIQRRRHMAESAEERRKYIRRIVERHAATKAAYEDEQNRLAAEEERQTQIKQEDQSVLHGLREIWQASINWEMARDIPSWDKQDRLQRYIDEDSDSTMSASSDPADLPEDWALWTILGVIYR